MFHGPDSLLGKTTKSSHELGVAKGSMRPTGGERGAGPETDVTTISRITRPHVSGRDFQRDRPPPRRPARRTREPATPRKAARRIHRTARPGSTCDGSVGVVSERTRSCHRNRLAGRHMVWSTTRRRPLAVEPSRRCPASAGRRHGSAPVSVLSPTAPPELIVTSRSLPGGIES